MSVTKKIVELAFEEYGQLTDLAAADKQLMEAAIEAQEQAYAPYSHFSVGAAVRLANGTIVRGNNQENAAYPSGLCAERVALFYAAAQYPNQAVEAIAITAPSAHDEPASPCGACRQVMAEYEHLHHRPMRILLGHAQSKIWVFGKVQYLLPFSFDGEALK